MTTDTNTLSERVSSSYTKLTLVANDLNVVSDELGKSVALIDDGLRKLNLGVSTWVKIFSWDGEREDPTFWSEDLGFAKVNGKWGVCLRRIDGNYQRPDEESETRWLFNDASRTLRLAAIDKIPELLESLNREAADTAKKIQAKLADVKAVATALNPPKPIKDLPAKKVTAANTSFESYGITQATMQAAQEAAQQVTQRITGLPGYNFRDIQKLATEAAEAAHEALVKPAKAAKPADVVSAVKK